MSRSSSHSGVFTRGLLLMEESLDLLRGLSVSAWLTYALGVVPFFALLLYASNNLARNPFAADSLLVVSLLLSAAYLWMHYCQARFAHSLAVHAGLLDPVTGQTHTSGFRLFCTQAMLQAAKLIAWPIGLGLVIPHGVSTLFFQHALTAPPEAARNWRSAAREAWADATYHQAEGLWLLVLVLLLRTVVFFNALTLVFVAVGLFHVVTGVNNDLTRAPANLLNGATLGACLIASYIALDPVVKAACVLRSLERRSLSTGLDLQLRLKRAVSDPHKPALAAASLLFWALLFGPAVHPLAAQAAPGSKASTRAPLSAAQVEKTVNSVFHDPTLVWDLPVVVKKKKPSNAFIAFTDSLLEELGQWWRELREWFDDIVARIRRMAGNDGNGFSGNEPRMASSQGVWLLLAGICALLAGGVFFAVVRSRRLKSAEVVAAMAVAPPAPDISREDVQAHEQPESAWMELAARYRRSGDSRLALRALYLSCLATLASAKLITIARGKSNLDYTREFQRRARRLSGDLPTTLRSSVHLFERSWYGEHPVVDETLDEFERNLIMLRAGAASATRAGAAL